MILKYRGFNNNWVYVEAKEFVVAKLLMPKTDEDQKRSSDPNETLSFIKAKHDETVNHIYKETSCPPDTIDFRVKGNIADITYFVVVMPYGFEIAYVLNTEAYLMTDSGKTVERIA